ncbi:MULTISPECIES: type II toxin-antitoxin system HigA family antitoxin [Cedecea]|uniref:DNA-binding helix-turn-helix protein n=1 Tax=Cedecea davisae DSM 4568 TaxID=566551 RepID=S3IG41_9ENTR|nr:MULTISPECIES: helix-turn-helix domain-containing protein [Cedecea]EPF12823.1 DNA-binding helix-turn-helix protein [Cedecea davisae DSM 4568]QIX95979.1 helix-turn-helix domain-containing protein [Cedecea sp. FDAARGOS_727]SUX37309.1 Antitoxin HigA [Cedecea davisae]
MIGDALKAGEALKKAVPLLAESASEKDYLAALELVEYLLLNDPVNPLLELVSTKITAYENSQPEVQAFREEMLAIPAGVAMLKTLMEHHQLKQSDFQQEIGSKSMVSRILKGERQLTTEHIRRLSRRFGISPALFF